MNGEPEIPQRLGRGAISTSHITPATKNRT
jgi:hypothetical protein